MSEESSGEKKHSVRICLDKPRIVSGPMGTAIVSTVRSFLVQRDDWSKALSGGLVMIPKHLTACGMTEARIREAVEKVKELEIAGTFIDIEVC